MGVVGTGVERVQHVESMPGVEQVIRVSKPYKLASSEHHPDRIDASGSATSQVGAGAPLVVIAGPCAVESREQLLATARWVKREGATHPARRRLQAAHLPVRLPGPRRRGPRAPRRGARGDRACPSSARSPTRTTSRSSSSTWTCSRSAPGTCPTSCSSRPSARAASRSCSSAACPRRSRSGSWPPSTSSRRATPTSSSASAASARFETGHPQHARPLGRAGPPRAHPPAGHGRSVARHRASVAGPADGRRRRRGRVPTASSSRSIPTRPRRSSDSEQSLSFPEFGDLMDDLRRHEYLRQPTAPGSRGPDRARPASGARLRGRIDDVDARIAALVEERAELAVAVQQTRGTRRPRPRRRAASASCSSGPAAHRTAAS